MIHHLKYAIRFLIRSKGFAAAVILTLAACIGVNVDASAVADLAGLEECLRDEIASFAV